VLSCEGPPSEVTGRARGRVVSLVEAILDGPRHELKTEGDRHLVKACLERLHSTLWTVWSDALPTPAEAVAGGGDGA
jgi:hypothetical protein